MNAGTMLHMHLIHCYHWVLVRGSGERMVIVESYGGRK